MAAAHVARRFPVIVPMVAEGLLHLTAVRLLAPHLGDENHLAVHGIQGCRVEGGEITECVSVPYESIDDPAE